MASNPSANLEPLCTREHEANKVRRFLRMHVGRGRRYTVAEFSEAVGFKPRVIEAAMAEGYDNRPPAIEFMQTLYTFFGAAFNNHMNGESGQVAYDQQDPPSSQDLDDHKGQSAVLAGALAMARALENDGVIYDWEVEENRDELEAAFNELARQLGKRKLKAVG